MSNDYITTKLGDVGKVSMCKRVLKHQTTDSGDIPFYKISTFGDKPNAFISRALYDEYRKNYSFPRKGEVLISAAGTLGKTVIYDGEPAYFQDSNIVWIENDETKILNSYLYYFYQTDPWLTTSGSTINRIYNDNLRNITVNHPASLTKQQEIASVLSTIDAKIECNKRINAELESLAKLLYVYWFVQFDFPDSNGKPYKSSGGLMVFNDALNREIPQGWDVTPLASWIAKDKTGDWGKEAPEGNHILRVRCIRGTDLNALNGNGAISAPIRYILQKNNSKLLTPFDFVIEISGGSPNQSTGRISNIIPETLSRFSDPIICSNFCKAISLRDNSYYFNFAYLWKSAYDSDVLFGWEGKTSGIKNLLFDAFTQKFYVPTPPQGIAKKFFEFVSAIESKKQLLCKENDYLETTRDWLLPMLMNGQVTVS